MVLENYFSADSDYVSCETMDCGEAECFDFSGEVTCMCVDTLTPPDAQGSCEGVDVIETVIGSGFDSSEDGVIPITPGMTLWNAVNKETTETPEPEQIPDLEFPSTYMILGLVSLALLALGLLVAIYVIFTKLRRSPNSDLESDAGMASKSMSVSQSPLLTQHVQTKTICPLLDSNSKPSLLPSSTKPNHCVGNFGTFPGKEAP